MVDIAQNTTDLLTGSVAQEKLVPLMNGAGIIPVGGIISIMPHLAGTSNITATTIAGLDGWVRCNGQTISDPQSPMNGTVVPNINNSVFLEGHTTSGSTGGSNSKTLAVSEIPTHKHGMLHSHNINHGHGLTITSNAIDSSHAHVVNSHSHDSGSYGARIGQHVNSITTQIALQHKPMPNWTSNVIGNVILNYSSAAIATQSWGVDVAGFSGTSAPTTGFAGNSPATITGSVTDMSGLSGNSPSNTSNEGSSTAFNMRPNYITTVYLIRIK